METKTQLAILAQLLKDKKPQTIRGIARSLKRSYPLIYNSIEKLRQQKLIVKEKLPPARIISLSENAPIGLLAKVDDERREEFFHQHKWIKVYLKDVLSATKTNLCILIIFGSYAQGKQTDKSDLDILAIVPAKEDLQEMESVLARPFTKVKKHLVIVDEPEFLEMLAKPFQLNVGNEALKGNIILYGAEQLHQIVKRSKKE